MSQERPILYSFRRCPYAIRARLAVAQAGVSVALREIKLREKHEAFLAVSASGTVPCLDAGSLVLDESLEIMIWALRQHDPAAWLDMPQEGWQLIEHFDGAFKDALDRTKYAVRYEASEPATERAKAHAILADLDAQMGEWVFERPGLADFAILPFVRQFAFIDKQLFDAQPWPRVHAWLDRFLSSDAFLNVMQKQVFWQSSDAPIVFPDPNL